MSTATLASPPKRQFTISSGTTRKAHRTLIYGVGGIGKTSLAASAPNVVFVDVEGGAVDLEVPRVEGIESWRDLRALLQSDALDSYGTIAIDSVSRCEELCKAHIVATVPNGKQPVTSVEDYGFGKGYVHLVDEWRRFIADLERHYRAGRNVVLIAHAHTGKTPNPAGDDYLRHEPRLYHGSGASVRAVTVEWCDHVLFINYDVLASKEKNQSVAKADGKGSRAIYTAEQATYVAKSRTLPPDPIHFTKGDASIWDAMRAGANAAPQLDVPDLD